ncbi:hypothetical protein [Caballeronia sp. J97]|uniref:hypothetical protein n=1 Tax=Caballeronia sp. J97 TaxID=2805429 RepID=UPI002AAFD3E9|nr:hypothetical protein [Caballeronia sp. J97]
MSTTRRAFLIATGVSGLPWIPFGCTMRASTRVWVVDEALPQSGVVVHRARMTGARVASLSGDAGGLWIERLSSSPSIAGITRFADAFVLSQLGAETGMRATRHRAFANGAVLWTLERC